MKLIDSEALVARINKTFCESCDSWNGVKCSGCQIEDAIIVIEDFTDNHPYKEDKKTMAKMDIRGIDGLWCDDITFCPEQCEWESCPRNSKNIRDRTIPHSYSVEIPQDCPKKQEGGEKDA